MHRCACRAWLARAHGVLGQVRSSETGRAGPFLTGMRIFEEFLARSSMIPARKLLTACGLERSGSHRQQELMQLQVRKIMPLLGRCREREAEGDAESPHSPVRSAGTCSKEMETNGKFTVLSLWKIAYPLLENIC